MNAPTGGPVDELPVVTDGGRYVVRPARGGDLPALRDVERAAGALFRDVGMDAVADDEPPHATVLATYQRDGRAWVAAGKGDVPVGYLLLDVVDRCAHVEQLTVDPVHGRRGLGRALLSTADGWAHTRGLAVLTLMTFSDVAWNAPYYARLGFDVVDEGVMTDGLRRLRDHEATTVLASWPRVAMRRAVR